MTKNQTVDSFLSNYDEQVFRNALTIREIILAKLPGIIEQIDMPAKMIAYCYGQKYAELICVLIPSKKGLKLGFNRGNELPDPSGLLKGTGKISRYVEIKSDKDINLAGIKRLLASALQLYNNKMKP